jgi:hypothetical protein
MARPPLSSLAEPHITRPHISGKRTAQAAFEQLCTATALLSSAAMTAPLTSRLVTAGPSINELEVVPAVRHTAEAHQRKPGLPVTNRSREIGPLSECR